MTFGILASRSMEPNQISRDYEDFKERFRLLGSFYELTEYGIGTAGEDYYKHEFELHLRNGNQVTNLAEGLAILWNNGRERENPIVVRISGAQKPQDLVDRLKGFEQFDLYAPVTDYDYFQRMIGDRVRQGGKFTEKSAPH